MTDLATGALAPLHNRDFRFLLAGFAIGQMLMPLQFITQILWVQSTAPGNIWLILVAFIATSRGLGGLAFGLYGGALADRFNRKHLLQLILGLQVLTTSAIAGFMYLRPHRLIVGIRRLFYPHLLVVRTAKHRCAHPACNRARRAGAAINAFWDIPQSGLRSNCDASGHYGDGHHDRSVRV